MQVNNIFKKEGCVLVWKFVVIQFILVFILKTKVRTPPAATTTLTAVIEAVIESAADQKYRRFGKNS
jgi:hypothetical protein